MKISDLKVNDDTITFKLKDADVSITNALRRTAIADIKTYAIDKVEIKKNTTVLPREYIVNRLYLVPVIVNKLPKEIPALRLHAYGPENGIIAVKTQDIKTVDGKKIDFLFNDIKIINLKGIPAQKEEIDIVIKLDEGTHRQHAKFSVVTVAMYEELSEFDFAMTFESRGGVPPKTIFKMTINTLAERLKNIINAMENKNTTKFIIKNDNEFLLYNEDDTVGNLLQHHILSQYHNNEGDFVSYNKPNPLEKYIIIKISGPDAQQILKKALVSLEKKISSLHSALK